MECPRPLSLPFGGAVSLWIVHPPPEPHSLHADICTGTRTVLWLHRLLKRDSGSCGCLRLAPVSFDQHSPFLLLGSGLEAET
mmetsp:Transcript_37677/g.67244  ORF Transcript_37677/g.67244 Transcript_37677/m.67244 type:complete len:82 (-) Transcript_37677:2866-3111(-)